MKLFSKTKKSKWPDEVEGFPGPGEVCDIFVSTRNGLFASKGAPREGAIEAYSALRHACSGGNGTLLLWQDGSCAVIRSEDIVFLRFTNVRAGDS